LKQSDLENRLIGFSILISNVIESLDDSKLSSYLGNQIIRSGTSSAIHYGEVQDAESKSDFIHKLKVILKELRETFIALKIIDGKHISSNVELIKKALKENDELIAIVVSSLKTVRKK
jgi:four helix bundle protein